MHSVPPSIPERYRPLARLLQEAGEGNRAYEGNSLEIITSGLRKRELLLEDIRRAKSYIHLAYYRFGNDKAGREVRDLLQQKAAEGVEVRLLNNNLSYWLTIPSSYYRKMTRAGVEVIPFTHFRHGLHKWLYRINHQLHHKLVVIDGQVGYTGGMNLNDNYFYKWRDTHLRLTGGIVTGLNALFMDTWRQSGGRFCYPPEHYEVEALPQEAPLQGVAVQLVADSPEVPGSAMLEAYEWLLRHARRYVYMQTPYFVPPPSLTDALRDAVKRGVDVRLMFPRKVDTPLMTSANRAYYKELQKAGVTILERDGAFMHCKTLVSDDEVTVIGASNLDWRSFYLNYEMNTIIYHRDTALCYKEVFQTDARQATEAERTAYCRFMRLFAKLL